MHRLARQRVRHLDRLFQRSLVGRFDRLHGRKFLLLTSVDGQGTEILATVQFRELQFCVVQSCTFFW